MEMQHDDGFRKLSPSSIKSLEEEAQETSRHDVISVEALEAKSPPQYDQWYAIVGAFSKRNITFDLDRLPALIGVAKTHHALVEDSYIAGLWMNDLIYGLLWKSGKYTSVPGSPKPRRHRPPEKYLAPSWSWVSLLDTEIHFELTKPSRNPPRPGLTLEVESQHDIDDGETDGSEACPDDYELPLLRILQAETSLIGRDEYGQVSDGHLRVHGLVRQHTYEAEMASERGPRPASQGFPDIGRINFDLDTPPRESFWCLLVLQLFGGMLPNTDLYFLVLEPTGVREAEYRRIGMGWVREKGWFKDGEWKHLTIV